MGVAIGARTLLDNAVPTGIDANYLFERGQEEGISSGDVLQLTASIIGETNTRLEARYGGLLYFTEMDYSLYRQGNGTRGMTQESAEFSRVDGKRSDEVGHMLPRRDFEDVNEFTEQLLRRANAERIRRDIQEVADRWENRVDYDVINRALSSSEELIGSSGYSPGWAVGSGVNVPYIPPQRGSIVFDSTHTQYLRTNAAISTSNTATTLDSAARLLSRLGHTGRKVALVSEADLAKYTGMDSTKFVRYVPASFQAQSGATDQTIVQGELEGVPGEIFGFWLSEYGVLELRYHERIPTTYGFVTKSYGNGNEGNGLAVRIEPGMGFGLMIDPEFRVGNMPRLRWIDYKATHGVGVNDRTNGVAFQIASGGTTYSSPTIS